MDFIRAWLSYLFPSPAQPALERMRLGPEGSQENPLMIQFFTWDSIEESMSWWKHFECELPYLSELGFTQAWLPPPTKATNKDGRGYDAYDLWDLGEFDQKGTTATRWGTKDELVKACHAAKASGIDVLIDAVLNHKLGADRVETFIAVPVDPENRLKDIDNPREIEGWTAFDFEGRSGKYSDFRWTHEHFTGLDWDDRSRTNHIYRITGQGRKGWSCNVDKELGNYDYLLGIDIDHRHPGVRNDLFNWGTWILETTGASGFRLDAIKHIDHQFLHEFISGTRQRSGNSRLFAVAEYWSGNLKLIQPYIKQFRGETAFFDVPLKMNFHEASKAGSRYDLRTILDNTIVQIRPGDAVTFVDNHDTVKGQTLESWVEDEFKIQAYALILLREHGYPCVFYGDLYPNRECYNEQISKDLTLLIRARKRFAYGSTKDYFDDRNCIGFVRMGDSTHKGCAVLISNKDKSDDFVHTIRMHVGKNHTGSTYRGLLEPSERTIIDSDGWGAFSCIPNGTQVWVPLDSED